MKKFILMLLSTSLLTACVTTAKFEQRMNANIGLNKHELIDVMGIPDREYKTEDFEIVEYNQSYTSSSNENRSTMVNGKLVNYTTSVPYTSSCKLEFKLIKDIVQSYRYKGDLCRSK